MFLLLRKFLDLYVFRLYICMCIAYVVWIHHPRDINLIWNYFLFLPGDYLWKKNRCLGNLFSFTSSHHCRRNAAYQGTAYFLLDLSLFKKKRWLDFRGLGKHLKNIINSVFFNLSASDYNLYKLYKCTCSCLVTVVWE